MRMRSCPSCDVCSGYFFALAGTIGDQTRKLAMILWETEMPEYDFLCLEFVISECIFPNCLMERAAFITLLLDSITFHNFEKILLSL